MSVSQEMNKLPSWETEFLRLTTFHNLPIDLREITWWQLVTGKQSDSKNMMAGFGQMVEVGTIGENTLQLQVQPSRIDWVLLGKQFSDDATFYSLGDFEASLKLFSDLISKWFSKAPEASRLAFGAQSFITTSGEVESTHIMSQKLDFIQIDWKHARDVMFQINDPHPLTGFSSVDLLNRVVKWQSVLRKRVSGSVSQDAQSLVATAERSAVLFEIDISTPIPKDTKTTIAPTLLDSLLAELIDAARGLAKKAFT